MAKYQKYAEYKDSGIDWMGAIPKEWSISRLKYIFTIRKRIAGTLGFDVLSITQRGIKVKDTESGDGQLSMDYSKYQLVYSGDFAMNHMDLLTGYVDISKFEGVTSPDYRVFTIDNLKKFNSQYYLYLLQMGYKQKLFFHLGQGSSHLGRWRLPTEAFNEVEYPIPSLNEQTQIANFLDHETTQIDTLIAKQEKLIELLKEKRQAVISHAVTKGLNPNAPMKDSGVEWLGEVPEYWEVRQLRYLGSCQNGINIGAEYFGSGSSFISYGDVYRNPELPRVFDGLVQSTENDKRIYSVQRGDVLFTRTSETIEEIGFSSTCLTDVKDATFAGFLIRFRPIQNTLLPEYSKFYFRNILLRAFFVKEMNLVTRASLSQELLKKLAVPFPSLEEQKQIADYLSAKERVFDKLVNDCIKQIELLKERRTALISAAVTGKIDVRNWQNPNKNNNQDKMELSA